ncbi:MAG: SRPBCC domain-containing protein [Myxococcota bacterium]|nr:SRPBCC domain-containing protein [Myxococcota bacterium]
MSGTDSVSASTTVDVDPATAFAVFTEEIDAWWGHGPRFRWRPRRGGRLRFEPGAGGRLVEVYDDGDDDAFEVGRVLVWEKAERLVFEFRARNFEPGQATEVEVRFEAVGQATRVTVEHRGWDALPPDHPARHGHEGPAFRTMMGLWWGDLLESARRHVSARGGTGRG